MQSFDFMTTSRSISNCFCSFSSTVDRMRLTAITLSNFLNIILFTAPKAPRPISPKSSRSSDVKWCVLAAPSPNCSLPQACCLMRSRWRSVALPLTWWLLVLVLAPTLKLLPLLLGTVGTAGTKLGCAPKRSATLFCCDEELEPDDVEPDDVDEVEDGGCRILKLFKVSWSGGMRDRLGPAVNCGLDKVDNGYLQPTRLITIALCPKEMRQCLLLNVWGVCVCVRYVYVWKHACVNSYLHVSVCVYVWVRRQF